MLESMPIIRGETGKVDLNIDKYQDDPIDRIEDEILKAPAASAARTSPVEISLGDARDTSTGAGRPAIDAYDLPLVQVTDHDLSDDDEESKSKHRAASARSASLDFADQRRRLRSSCSSLNATASVDRSDYKEQRSRLRSTGSKLQMLPDQEEYHTPTHKDGYGSFYRNEAWIRIDSGTDAPKPTQLIPATDKSVPLAKKHSHLIMQCVYIFPAMRLFIIFPTVCVVPWCKLLYFILLLSMCADELALKEEKERNDKLVKQKRNTRIKEAVVLQTLEMDSDNEADGIGHAGSDAARSNSGTPLVASSMQSLSDSVDPSDAAASALRSNSNVAEVLQRKHSFGDLERVSSIDSPADIIHSSGATKVKRLGAKFKAAADAVSASSSFSKIPGSRVSRSLEPEAAASAAAAEPALKPSP